MTSTTPAVKTRHKKYSLLFPLAALGVLSLWGTATALDVLVAINLLALLGILVSAFNVVATPMCWRIVSVNPSVR